MPLALEIVTARIVNGVAFAAATPIGGPTFGIRDFPEAAGARLEDVWGDQATQQTIRVRSPRMHDFSNGLRIVAPAGVTRALLPHEVEEPMFPSDVLTVESLGTAAEVDLIALMMYYRDLPGISARLETWEALKPRIAHVLAVEVDLAAPAVTGNYSAALPIDGIANCLKANTDYAILGYLCNSQCGVVGFTGTDFGNLRVGGPGAAEPDDTREWFVRQSLLHGTPHIPVFNSNNKGNVLVDVAKVALTATVVTAILAALD